MRTSWPFLGPGEARDKFDSAAMAVMSEEKCILAVGVFARLELVQRGHPNG
jgi:hypothetical protein